MSRQHTSNGKYNKQKNGNGAMFKAGCPRSDDLSDNWIRPVSERALLDLGVDNMHNDFESVYKAENPGQKNLNDGPEQIFDLRSKIKSKSNDGTAPLAPSFIRNKQYNNGRQRWNSKNFNATSGNHGYNKNNWAANSDLRFNQRFKNNNNIMVPRRNDNCDGDWRKNIPKILKDISAKNSRVRNENMTTGTVSLTPQATVLRDLESVTVDNEVRIYAFYSDFYSTQLTKYVRDMTAPKQTVHKPVYDMKIQKKIAIIQNKQLLYTSNGAVIGPNGPGIEKCTFIPKSTGVSMNDRFR